jgi:hypothetical protein
MGKLHPNSEAKPQMARSLGDQPHAVFVGSPIAESPFAVAGNADVH